MATQTANIVETVSIGRILSRTGAVLAAHPVTMFGIAFVFGAIPAVLVSWFQVSLRTRILDRYQMMGVIAVAIVARSEERRVGKECVRKGESRWSPAT